MSTTDACTCCKVHNRGVHRTGELVSPSAHMSPADPPELAKATKTRDAAAARAEVAQSEWGTAEQSRRTLEAAIVAKYSNTYGLKRGIDAATDAERAELDKLKSAAEKLRVKAREGAQLATEARQLHAVAQSRATQSMIANW